MVAKRNDIVDPKKPLRPSVPVEEVKEEVKVVSKKETKKEVKEEEE